MKLSNTLIKIILVLLKLMN